MSAIPTSSFIVSDPTELQDYEHLAPSAQDDAMEDGRDQYQAADERPSLPEIDCAMDLVADANIVLPPQLIEGVLHQGLKGVIGSSSKARKTWILLDLALSVATGTKWWKWNTIQGRVLVVNFEIPKPFLKQRIEVLARRKNLTDYSQLDIWTLRGHGSNFDDLISAMIERIKESRYSLIIIDPIYKGLSGKDENRAGDIGQLCDLLESLAVETGAAVLYAHHFSKGKQATKDPIDRFSGSGVFARDADSIIVMTKHKDEDCYTVDLVLRNLAEQESFVVKWDYPVMRVECTKDPTKLQDKGGAPKKADDDEVLELLRGKPLSHAEWKKLAVEGQNCSDSTFERCRKILVAAGKVVKNADGKWQLVMAAAAATIASSDDQPPVYRPPQSSEPAPPLQCQMPAESSAPKPQAVS